MQRENPGRRLVRIRPRHGTTYISQSRTVFSADRDGLIRGGSEKGLFFHETRILSRYRYLINGEEPVCCVVSNVEQHSWLGYYMTSVTHPLPSKKDEGSGAVMDISQDTLELRVSRFIGEGMHEDLDFTNFTQRPARLRLDIEIDADFADQLETITGRVQTGKLDSFWRREKDHYFKEMTYYSEHSFDHQENQGTASIQRGVAIEILQYDDPPESGEHGVHFSFDLQPGNKWHTCVNVIPVWDGQRVYPSYRCRSFDPGESEYDRRRMIFLSESTTLKTRESETLSAGVMECFYQARNDLAALRLYDLDINERVWIPAAGLPMYVALFGRDTLTTALQAAMLNANFIDGTLTELGRWQGKQINRWRDEEPGRMLHEAHTGPLSMLNYHPRSRYYGSITTSGFYPVVLAELWHWTGDRDRARALLPYARSALQWLAEFADLDRDGFYEYKTKSTQGTKHQAWKDSGDAVVYTDGSQVEPPIAACEEQAFVYVAKFLLSEVLWWLDEKDDARRLYHESQELKKRFNEAFWMEQEGFIAMGLDSQKRRIESIASNAGHCIAAGIVDDSLVRRVAVRMMEEDLFSGWGIRTLSSHHPAFNPYSYHRGSVWPVEQGTFVFGFSRFGLFEEAHRLSKAFFEAAALFDHHRLPELFSGHQRDPDHPFPALYIQANSPQAWSASAVFHVLQSLLGLYPYAPLNLLLIDPHLPEWLPEITLGNLHVGNAICEIRFFRKSNGESEYEVLDQKGSLRIIRQPSPWSLTAGFAERVRDLLNSFL